MEGRDSEFGPLIGNPRWGIFSCCFGKRDFKFHHAARDRYCGQYCVPAAVFVLARIWSAGRTPEKLYI
jgi:hypothetical protein